MKRPLKVQIIVTPGGERMAILPEAELDALLALVDNPAVGPADRPADGPAYGSADGPAGDDFTAALASEMEEVVPSGFLDRLLSGANPIKVWREYRGLSIIDLAETTAVPAPRLLDLETGSVTGSPAEIHAIAIALKLAVDDLV